MAEDSRPQLRLLREDELGLYKQLRDDMLEAHPTAFSSDAAAERQRTAASYRSRLQPESGHSGNFTLCAWDSERLLGAVSCERDMRLKLRHIGHLVGMMVRDEAQGRGIGKALLYACIEHIREVAGIELLTLSVTAGNAAASALYEHAGFVRYGSLPQALKLGDTYFAKDLMALALSPRSP